MRSVPPRSQQWGSVERSLMTLHWPLTSHLQLGQVRSALEVCLALSTERYHSSSVVLIVVVGGPESVSLCGSTVEQKVSQIRWIRIT